MRTRPGLDLFLPRLFFAPLFVVAGLKHVLAPADIAARLAKAPLGHLAAKVAPPELLVVLTGVVLVAGGLAILAGLQTRVAALALAVVLVPITVSVQVGSADTTGPLLKNVAIFGGLLFLAMNGAGEWSLDRVLAGKRTRALAAAALAGAVSVAALPGLAVAAPAAQGARVLILVQNPSQLAPVLATARDLLAGRGFAAKEVEILACGEAVTALTSDSPAAAKLAAAQADGARFVACGLTLEKKKLAREALHPAVDVVPNGLVETLRLQSEGWKTIEL